MPAHPRHDRYDHDERRLLETAADELPAARLIGLVTDVAARFFNQTTWGGVPADAPDGWKERRVAAAAFAAIGLRTTRVVALTVRAGYGPEALGGIRKLQELAGHAERNAADESGQYARNWFERTGKAGRASVAFKAKGGDDETWSLLSASAHGSFQGHAATSFSFTPDRTALHKTGPERHPSANSNLLWLASHLLIHILAGGLKVYPEADQADWLAAAEQVDAADPGPPDEGAEAEGQEGRQRAGDPPGQEA